MTRDLIAKERRIKLAASQELEKLAAKLQEEFNASEEGVNEALLVAAQSKSDLLRYRKRMARPIREARQNIRLACRVIRPSAKK